MNLLTADSPEILRFLRTWRIPYGRKYSRAVKRSKYIAIDHDNGPNSWSGFYLVDRETHDVYTIKGYGKRGWYVGQLEELTRQGEQRSDSVRLAEAIFGKDSRQAKEARQFDAEVADGTVYYSFRLNDGLSILMIEHFYNGVLVDTDFRSKRMRTAKCEAKAIKENQDLIAKGTHISCVQLEEAA